MSNFKNYVSFGNCPELKLGQYYKVEKIVYENDSPSQVFKQFERFIQQKSKSTQSFNTIISDFDKKNIHPFNYCGFTFYLFQN